jgi:hypothetical protein
MGGLTLFTCEEEAGLPYRVTVRPAFMKAHADPIAHFAAGKPPAN